MKKFYTKPDIVFEDFSLSTSIAGACETVLSTPTSGTCAVQFGRLMVFTDQVSGCAKKVVDGSEDYNKLCYHVPTEANNVFTS